VATTQELKALMILAQVEQSDIAQTMRCSIQMISKVIREPARYPNKSKKIYQLLVDLVHERGYSIVRSVA
jgi:hypothetical protein